MKKAREEESLALTDLPPGEGSLTALLRADFAAHGAEVIEVVRRKHPTIYLRLVADELPRELSKAAIELGDIGDEELANIIRGLRTKSAAPAGKRARPAQRGK